MRFHCVVGVVVAVMSGSSIPPRRSRGHFREKRHNESWETKGAWTEEAAGSTIPRQFVCTSSPNADGQTWAVRLHPQK